jgi:hypothetical protein
LRLDLPLRADFEEPWNTHAPPRLMVDRSAGDTLRAVGRDWPPALLSLRGRSSPTRDRGLGLFVQRKAELHVESPRGPVVGWADVGTYLPIVGFGAASTEVVLPDYRDPKPGVALASAFVDSSALGVAEPLPPAFSPAAPADYTDVIAPMAATAGGVPFAVTACGGLRVIGREGARVQVSQVRDGIHVTGWLAEAPPTVHGENRCDPRVVQLGPRGTDAPPLPAGYVAYTGGDAVNDPLGPTLRHRGVVVWLVKGDDGSLRCEDWTAVAVEARDHGVSGHLQRDTTVDGHRTRVVFDVEAGPRDGAPPSMVSLEGPSWSSPNGEGIALCGTIYSVVAADGARVTLVRGAYLDGLAGYHPEDTEVWYLSHATCEAARREPQGGALSASQWVHRGGC